jgi:hypothetical protein
MKAAMATLQGFQASFSCCLAASGIIFLEAQ